LNQVLIRSISGLSDADPKPSRTLVLHQQTTGGENGLDSLGVVSKVEKQVCSLDVLNVASSGIVFGTASKLTQGGLDVL